MVAEQLTPAARVLRRLTPVLAAVLFVCAGCASTPPTAEAPAQAPESAGGSGDSEQTPDATDRAATRNPSGATLALLQQSERARANGSLSEAIAYAERAVRIDPRDANLWIRLAELELANEQPLTAIQYANKAITLAASRVDRQRDAWLVIADARAALGDVDEAARIRKRWQSYRG